MPLSILLHYSTAIVQSLQFIWTKQFPSHTLFNTVLFPACSSDSLSHQTPTTSYDSDLLPVFLISSSWQWSPKRTLFCSSAPRASSQALSHIFLCIMACWSIYHTLGILCVAQLFLLLVVWLLGKEADLEKKIQIASSFFRTTHSTGFSLYGKKWARPLNLWYQVFSAPLQQMYKIKQIDKPNKLWAVISQSWRI